MNYPSLSEKQALYNQYAEAYEQRTAAFREFLRPDYEQFAAALPGPKVIDLGCGPGRDCAVFLEMGLQPLGIDASEEMLRLACSKGIATAQMDLENLTLAKEAFDGIWSYTALTTLPKFKTWEILTGVADVLVANGVLFLGLIEGQGEYWKPPDVKYTLPRYVSRYQRDEVIAKLESTFELIYFRKIPSSVSSRNNYLNFLFRKRLV